MVPIDGPADGWLPSPFSNPFSSGQTGRRPPSAELLRRFDLVDAAGQTPSTYSGGMRRKLDLAMTLVGDPRVIFLDEPTAGLDPRTRRTMWQIIRDLVSDGVTIFLSTQYLEEADELADRIVLLDHGRLVAEGTADELKQMIPGGHIRLQFADQAMLEVAERVFAGSARNDEALALQVPAVSSRCGPSSTTSTWPPSTSRPSAFTHPDLDDVFLAMTGPPAEDRDDMRTETQKETAR